MQNCLQTEGQSIYQHGLSVQVHYLELLSMLRLNVTLPGWKVPDWLFLYKDQILSSLLSDSIIEEYTVFHDCGKPYCLEIDSNGKKHFPNHAAVSAQTWLAIGGSPQVARLIEMDMIIHKIKSSEIDSFIQKPEAITLLLAGLAEVHSNAKMFGGLESDSFKIKWKQINKKGKIICQKLFKEKNNVIDWSNR